VSSVTTSVVQPAESDRHADRGVRLVDVGVRRERAVGLGGAAHVAERRRAVVARTGVDAGEVDHGLTLRRSRRDSGVEVRDEDRCARRAHRRELDVACHGGRYGSTLDGEEPQSGEVAAAESVSR
jgi:hypothetical protein